MDSEQKKAVQSAWDLYVKGGKDLPPEVNGVRPEILESWRRSLKTADPEAEELPCLSGEKFQDLCAKNALFIMASDTYLQRFSTYLSDTSHQFTLADSHGYQLKRVDSGMREPKKYAFLLRDGVNFSEEAAGTNGIGTCLFLKRPVSILGPEHFHLAYHDMACSAAPIHDPAGDVLGCINITGPLDQDQKLIMGILLAAVTGIETELRLRQTNSMLEGMLDAADSGVLLLDWKGRVLHANSVAFDLLGGEGRSDVPGCSIFDLVDEESLPPVLHGFGQAIENVECRIYTTDQVPLDVSVTVRRLEDSSFSGMMIQFRSRESLHSLASRTAGFQARSTLSSIMGTSRAVETVKALAKTASGVDVPVLISGEPGTGKEVLAQAIHNEGSHSGEPFTTFECKSSPKSQLEEELFGTVTPEGEVCPGRIELSNGGTLYLHDIAFLPMHLQKRLVTTMNDKAISFPNSSIVRSVRFRLIASDSGDLYQFIESGKFDDGLYYLLNSFHIVIPPLRQRQEDITFIANQLLRKLAPEKRFSSQSEAAMLEYSWPQNVSELETEVEQAAKSSEGNIIELENLSSNVVSAWYQKTVGPVGGEGGGLSSNGSDATLAPAEAVAKAWEYRQMTDVLQKTGGNVKDAAARLGVPVSTLYRKLKKSNINPKDFKSF